MQSSEEFKTPLTLILSPLQGRGEERAATTFMNKSSSVSPLLLEKRRGEGEELMII
jgi:hypothetical protein